MTTVAIYDSGVGGLSIYQEARRACSDFSYVFVSDNQAYPYGTKSERELIGRVLQVSDGIVQRFAPDVLVLACNTASTVCLPSLRKAYGIPVIGVVPAIKPAAQASKNKIIGLLATPATIARAYTDDLITDFAADCEVLKVGSTELVNLAEKKLNGFVIPIEKLKSILAPFIEAPKLDTLVLACTHFPLLKDEIERVFEAEHKDVALIDSGKAIANRLMSVSSDWPSAIHASNIAAFTDKISSSDFIENLEKLDFDRIEQLKIT